MTKALRAGAGQGPARGAFAFPLCALAAASALALALAAGCGRPQGDALPDVHVAWSVRPQPPSIGKSSVSVALTDDANHPLAGAAVRIEADMSHPGMVPVFGQGVETAPGFYEAPIEFTMAGDWTLLLDATLHDGRHLQQQHDLPGVRSSR